MILDSFEFFYVTLFGTKTFFYVYIMGINTIWVYISFEVNELLNQNMKNSFNYSCVHEWI